MIRSGACMQHKPKRQQLTAGDPAWEKICERCGRCCYEKYEYRSRVFYTKTPCPQLDLKTRLCRVYDRRAEAHPDCVRLTPELVRAGILPADCPYVKRLDGCPAAEMEKNRD